MRVFSSMVIATLMACSTLVAQQPPAPVAPPGAANPAANRLDALLTQWEQKMKGVESLVAVLKRTEIDPITKKKDEYQGQLKFMRPNRAELHMQKTTNPQVYERFLCTGTYLYQYLPSQKEIQARALPQRAPGQPIVDNSFVGFLAGMGAVEARRRFDLTLIKEDQWYAYIYVKPRLPEDKAEFSEARLALLQSTMMPAQMKFIPANGAEITWSIEKIDTNVRVVATDFAPPQLPAGWQMKQIPTQGGPAAAIPPANPPPTKARPVGQ